MMRLWIASDHAGFPLKKKFVENASRWGVTWIDLGTDSEEQSVDYPQFGESLARAVIAGTQEDERLKPCGVLICGSGVGVSIAANRFAQVRAVLALRADVAKLSREHNASNVLCLGARILNFEEAVEIFETWLATPFEGGRHQRRVDQLTHMKGKHA